jgi:hypothetical protein
LRVGLAIVVSSFATACYTMPRLSKVIPSESSLTSYSLGEIHTAAVGSVMIERVDGTLLLPGFVLASSAPIELQSLPPDRTIWPARYRYEDGPCSGGVYVLTRPDYRGETMGVVVAADGSFPCESPLVELAGCSAGRTWPTGTPAGSRSFDGRPFVAGASRKFLRWQLIYEGRTGNELTIDYKQFSDSGRGTQPQPEHYQELKYDLAKDKKLRFQDTEIEVLEASNAGIRFRVLRDDGDALRMKGFWDGKPSRVVQ